MVTGEKEEMLVGVGTVTEVVEGVVMVVERGVVEVAVVDGAVGGEVNKSRSTHLAGPKKPCISNTSACRVKIQNTLKPSSTAVRE